MIDPQAPATTEADETPNRPAKFAVRPAGAYVTSGGGIEPAATVQSTMLQSQNLSLSRLFMESHSALRRYVRRLVPSRETADEVVQEAFLRTCEHAEGLQTPRAFLFTTARNLAADARRAQRVRKTDTAGFLDSLSISSGELSPEAQTLADEDSRLLKEAIERLPPQCRAVFALKVFHACSYKDIAQRMSLSPKTVENHVARALRETNQYLRRRCK